MAETGGYGRFPGSLDPRAEEFRPRYPTNPGTTVLMAQPQPQPHQIFYPYSSPYPPISNVPVLPFCEGGVGYPPPCVAVRSGGHAQSSVATRSLLLSSVPCDVSETMVRRELEGFGDVRGVQMERVSDGIVIVHFYDIRHAERALREIREQHMHHQCRLRNYFNNRFFFSNSASQFPDFPLPPRPSPARGLIAGHAVWAHFVVPASNAVPAGKNQGTIVIFNLDSAVSTSCLTEIFEAFGIQNNNSISSVFSFDFGFKMEYGELFDGSRRNLWGLGCGVWDIYLYIYITQSLMGLFCSLSVCSICLSVRKSS